MSELNPVYADLEAARTRIRELESKLDAAEKDLEAVGDETRHYVKLLEAAQSRLDKVREWLGAFDKIHEDSLALRLECQSSGVVERQTPNYSRCPKCNGILGTHAPDCSCV